MTTGRAIRVVGFAAALVTWSACHGRAGDPPSGQSPLADVTALSLDALKTEFNGASDEPRIVLLLSPT